MNEPRVVFDRDGRVIDLEEGVPVESHGPPGPILWLNVIEVPQPLGQCAAAYLDDGAVEYQLRVTRRPYAHLGDVWVDVCRERDWWRWAEDEGRSEWVARSMPRRAADVWVQVYESPQSVL